MLYPQVSARAGDKNEIISGLEKQLRAVKDRQVGYEEALKSVHNEVFGA